MNNDQIKAACLRKKLYVTRNEADRAVLLCYKREPTLTLRIYHCSNCQGFHLTSKPFKRFEPIKITW